MISNEEKEIINAISNDEERARYIINLIKKTKDIEYSKCVDGITDTFYIMKIRSLIEKNLESDILSEFEQENNEYKNILEATSNMTEEEMCEYISRIKNKDIKLLFFNRANMLDNKKIILESIEPKIDDNLKEPVQLVQDMSKENLSQIVRENIFTKIVKWFKKIINKKVKNNVALPQNKIINNTTKEDFISTINVEENIKMKQKKLKDNRINISELSNKELKQMIELYKSQIKRKKTELKKYRKMIFNNS